MYVASFSDLIPSILHLTSLYFVFSAVAGWRSTQIQGILSSCAEANSVCLFLFDEMIFN